MPPKKRKARIGGGKNKAKSGKETRKGVKGVASNYIHRTKAVRRLQVSLRDFRRLCILKGIYPRDPKKKPHGNDKTYYHIKDIKYLMHEPLLKKFRDMKAFLKKHKKAMIKREFSHAKSLERNLKPRLNLDHLIKERYPSFVDAVRDLDDPLSMIFLFSLLPSKTCDEHEAEANETCSQLAREFLHWVIKSKSLRKVFVSVKGIYYQAEVYGHEVTWLVPHKFKQSTPKDVDFRVMVTFLQFYITLVGFVNFKLYYDLGLRYPPKLKASKENQGAFLTALQVENQEVDTQENSSANEMRLEIDTATFNPIEQKKNQDKVSSVIKNMNRRREEMEEDGGADIDRDDNGSQGEERAQVEGEEAEEKGEGHDTKAEMQENADQLLSNEKEQIEEALGENKVEDDEKLSIFSGLLFLIGRETPQDSLEFIILAGGGDVLRELDLSKEQTLNDRITHQIVDRPSQQQTLFSRQYVQPQWVYDSFNVRALLPIEYYKPGAVLPPHLSPFVDDEKEGYIPKQREVLRSWGGEGQGKPSQISEIGKEEKAQEKTTDRDGMAEHDKGEDEDEDEDEDEEAKVREQSRKRDAGDRAKNETTGDEDLAKIMMTNKTRRLYDRMKFGQARKEAVNENLRRKRQKLEKKKN